ncbi:glutathione S-transferase domain protein (plasmid) [Fischerella sp. NIES-4106]|nr:glutathione S-transferase domain protein [Fischerella sp. NIES-4106]
MGLPRTVDAQCLNHMVESFDLQALVCQSAVLTEQLLLSRCDTKFTKLAYSYLSHKRDASQEDSITKDDQLRTQLEDELRFLDNVIGSTDGSYTNSV